MAPRIIPRDGLTVDDFPPTIRSVLPVGEFPCAGRTADDRYEPPVRLVYSPFGPGEVDPDNVDWYKTKYSQILFTFVHTLNTELLVQNVGGTLLRLAARDLAYRTDIAFRSHAHQIVHADALWSNVGRITVSVLAVAFAGGDLARMERLIDEHPTLRAHLNAAGEALLAGWDTSAVSDKPTAEEYQQLAAQCPVLVGDAAEGIVTQPVPEAPDRLQ